MKYYLVLVTKYRHQCSTSEMLTRMKEIVENLFSSQEVAFLKFGGEADHIYFLMNLNPISTKPRFGWRILCFSLKKQLNQ